MIGSYFLDAKQYSDSNNIHIPPRLLPAESSTILAMCCREQAQRTMSDASEMHLQMDDRHIITPMAEGKRKKKRMKLLIHHSDTTASFLHNPTSVFNHLSHRGENVNFLFLLPLPFVSIRTVRPEFCNLKCVIWDCFAWSLGVCMYVHVCACDPSAQQTRICLLVWVRGGIMQV